MMLLGGEARRREMYLNIARETSFQCSAGVYQFSVLQKWRQLTKTIRREINRDFEEIKPGNTMSHTCSKVVGPSLHLEVAQD